MLRVAIASLVLGLGAPAIVHSPPAAWPLRASVADLAGKPVAFHALALGGELIIQFGPPFGTPRLRSLARGDTLSATTPAQYPLDLAHGPVVFFTSSKDSIRVVVGRNPFGSSAQVGGKGRRLTVRLVDGKIVIDAR